MKKRLITFSGRGEAVEAADGANLLDIAAGAGILVAAECGGRGTCGKCEAEITTAGKKAAPRQALMCCEKATADIDVRILSPYISQKIEPFPHPYTRNIEMIDPLVGGHYGVAIDLGTSTICARLMSMETGGALASVVCANPQRLHGADVASRCDYAMDNAAARKKLRGLVVDKCDMVIRRLAEGAKLKAQEISSVVVAGNTVMLHLFLGANTDKLAVAPYIPEFIESRVLSGREAGLNSVADAIVITVPCVAGYVGGDAVAACSRAMLGAGGGIELLVDLGTNAEAMLSARGKIFTCASAAGPAIEGAHLSCGASASPGAVSRVALTDRVEFSTIENAAPYGICGTGMMDAISEMLRTGIVDASGRMAAAPPVGLPKSISGRSVERDGRSRFVIAAPGEHGAVRELSVSQEDVRAFQLGKSAVRSGIEILMREANIEAAEIDRIYLAGALGTYLDPRSAIASGVLPPVPESKIHFIGNAALDGSVEIMMSKEKMRAATEIATRSVYIELSSLEDFMDVFVRNISFTEQTALP